MKSITSKQIGAEQRKRKNEAHKERVKARKDARKERMARKSRGKGVF